MKAAIPKIFISRDYTKSIVKDIPEKATRVRNGRYGQLPKNAPEGQEKSC